MGLKDKLFKVLSKAKDELTEEDRAQIKVLLDGGEAADDASPERQAEPENEEPSAIDSETNETPQDEEQSEQPAAEAQEGAQGAESPTQDDAEETADKAQPTEDEAVLQMSKGVQPLDEETAAETLPAPQITDTEGEELPTDYQQIIDALTAKNMALEAENARLKAKTEAAFGLSAKPGEFARVNPLYDNDTSDIHFKK